MDKVQKDIIKDEIRAADFRLKKEKNKDILRNIKNFRNRLKKILKA